MSESARDSHRGSVDTLMLAYLCMAANGTDDYDKIDMADRGIFEHYTITGQLFGEIEKLKVDAEVEARMFELQIPEEALSVYCMSSVQLGIPLPPAVRDHLSAISSRLLALILRISAARRMRSWDATRTDNVLSATPTHDPFAKVITLQVAEQTEPKSLPAHDPQAQAVPQHAPDFSWVRCHLGEFTFSATQRTVVAALWADWEAGGLGLSNAHLSEVAGRDESRLRDLFKDHRAWSFLIVQGERRGTSRLAFDRPV